MSIEHGSSSKDENNKNNDTKVSIIPSRDEAIINTIINTSVILMSTMMDAFGELMVQTTGTMAAGIATAFDEEEMGQEINNEVKNKLPEVNETMKAMISEIKNDIYQQFNQKQKEIQPIIADPAYDNGPKIVEKYDFNLPKINEKLDDKTLAQYSLLLITEDNSFAQMFKELTDWMNEVPNFPGGPN